MSGRASVILRVADAPEAFARAAGGKGAALDRLRRAGIPVPVFFVVGTEAFEAFFRANALARDVEESAVLAAKMPEEIRAQIAAAFNELGAARVAVRSSAAAEDSAAHSFAGQLKSFLYVESAEAAVDAVKGCWASAFTVHARAYMQQKGLAVADARVGVVVQKMVDAEAAGVAFTIDPAGGARDRVVVSAVWGQGEGLVSGRFDADTFDVSRTTKAVVSRRIVAKPAMLVRENGGGLREEKVAAVKVDQPSVDDARLADIAEMSLALERLFGRPQDVEWAVESGKVHALQSRPITAVAGPREPVKIWDNSNIVESYAGVTSPFTYSFARHAYYHVYVQFCEVMGVPASVIRERDRMLRNMLGYLDGRVYYDLLHWYGLVALFPGFKNNKQFMEGMMGVRESLPEDAQRLLVLPGGATLGDRIATLKLSAKMLVRFLRLRTTVTDFRAFFEENYARYRTLDMRGKTVEELLALFREMENVFLKNWKAPLINDFFAMVCFGLVRKWTKAWGIDEAGGLQNDLLCGEGGVESALPTEALLGLATDLRANAAWAACFRERGAEEVRRAVENEPGFEPVKKRIVEYVDRFGFRCMNELKLEEPDLHTDPTPIYRMLANYVKGTPPTVEDLRRRELAIRGAAEKKVREKIGGFKRFVFFRTLANARETVKNRENLRLARTKVFGLARRIIDAAGQDLALRGVLSDPRDVYFLTREELESFVDGSLPTRDLAGVAALRKADHVRFVAAETDDRFVTRGAPYSGNAFRTESPKPVGDGLLTGIGCCPGEVTARARVILDPKGDLSLGGNILVAKRTDPGWTPLFPSASGILVERGSLLSHSAIVARELGIPCVVGIPNLIDRVKDGDTVRMDGAAGWARVEKPADR